MKSISILAFSSFSDITDNMKFRKVCTACFTRLNRRIAQLTDGNSTGTGNTKTEPENTSTTWLEDEIETLKNCLKNSGRNWALISQKLNETKTPEQCKKFFYNNRKKQQLDKLVTEYKRVRYLSKKQKTFKTISSQKITSCFHEFFSKIFFSPYKLETSLQLCLQMKSQDLPRRLARNPGIYKTMPHLPLPVAIPPFQKEAQRMVPLLVVTAMPTTATSSKRRRWSKLNSNLSPWILPFPAEPPRYPTQPCLLARYPKRKKNMTALPL